LAFRSYCHQIFSAEQYRWHCRQDLIRFINESIF
jgi:hypothetical protein